METIEFLDIEKTLLGRTVLRCASVAGIFDKIFDKERTPRNMEIMFSINGVELPVVEAFQKLEEQDSWRIKVAARKLLNDRMGDFSDKLTELEEVLQESASKLLGVRYNHKGSIIMDGEEE